MGVAKLVGNVATCGAFLQKQTRTRAEWQGLQLCVQVRAFLCFGAVHFGLGVRYGLWLAPC